MTREWNEDCHKCGRWLPYHYDHCDYAPSFQTSELQDYKGQGKDILYVPCPKCEKISPVEDGFIRCGDCRLFFKRFTFEE